MDQAALVAFLADSVRSVGQAIWALFLPGLVFLALGFAAKGRALFTDMARAAGQVGLNMRIMVFNLVLVTPLVVMMIEGMARLIHGNGLWLVAPTVWQGLSPVLVVFVAVFVGDFTGYWRHRLEHTALLWPAHAVHHSDDQMTWTAIERFHPINRLTTVAIDMAVLMALGLPPYAVIANNWVRHHYGEFIHADLPWTYGPLGRIFVSPAMHRWHHAADPAAFDTNYATVFSIFDRAFGTWRVPGPCTAPLGVTDDIAPTLAGQIAYPFLPRAYRRLWQRDGAAPTPDLSTR
jgi:sterol desaturase/sphingolipid hydroxylase (fatty acid hydroxylase superfamily)